MTDKEIVQALRICATHIEKDCGFCPQMKYVRCTERLADKAITMIERLTAENVELLGYVKLFAGCDMCRHSNYCKTDCPCDECEQDVKENCYCKDCERGSNWEWRGLPEAPEEGEKA